MIINLLLKKKYLRRISEAQQEKFGKCENELKSALLTAQRALSLGNRRLIYIENWY